jgi:hypothetical protein
VPPAASRASCAGEGAWRQPFRNVAARPYRWRGRRRRLAPGSRPTRGAGAPGDAARSSSAPRRHRPGVPPST